MLNLDTTDTKSHREGCVSHRPGRTATGPRGPRALRVCVHGGVCA